MASKLVIIVTNSRCCVYIPNSHLSWTWSSSASQMNLKELFVVKLCKYQSFCTVKLKHLIEVSGRQIWSCLWPAFLSNSCPISGSGSFLETEVGHCASSNMSQAVENKRFPLAARLVQVRTFVIPYTAQTQVFWTKTGCGLSCFSPQSELAERLLQHLLLLEFSVTVCWQCSLGDDVRDLSGLQHSQHTLPCKAYVLRESHGILLILPGDLWNLNMPKGFTTLCKCNNLSWGYTLPS